MKRISVLALIGLAAISSAQDDSRLGFTARFGQLRPIGRDAKGVGTSWFVVGVEKRLKTLSATERNSEYMTVSLDYYSKSKFQSAPLLINYVSKTDQILFFGGVGVAATALPREVSGETQTSRSIQLGYQVGVGYEFGGKSNPMVAEARFLGNGESRVNGFSIGIAIRL